MVDIIPLENWRFDLRNDGRFYIIGDIHYGRRWQTTQVLELMTYDNCYTVKTTNSMYILYF
jgi:hypothetical protein